MAWAIALPMPDGASVQLNDGHCRRAMTWQARSGRWPLRRSIFLKKNRWQRRMKRLASTGGQTVVTMMVLGTVVTVTGETG